MIKSVRLKRERENPIFPKLTTPDSVSFVINLRPRTFGFSVHVTRPGHFFEKVGNGFYMFFIIKFAGWLFKKIEKFFLYVFCIFERSYKIFYYKKK